MSRLVRALSLRFSRQELFAAVLLMTMAASLLAFQYVTLAKFAVLPPGFGLVTLQEWTVDVPAIVGLSWADAALPLCIVGVGIGLAVLEWGRPSRRD